jgi:capsular polysaccharide biosynthesis protein
MKGQNDTVELRAYWTIIWRRIWLVALIVGVVVLYIGYQVYHLRKAPGGLTAYQSSITFQVGLLATTRGTDPSYADNVTVSEALADTLVLGPVLTSKEFDTEVSHQVGLDMGQIVQRYGPNPDLGNWQDTSAIGAALNATRVHSLVTVNVTWSSLAGAWAIAHAIGEVCANDLGTYLNYVIANNATQTSGGIVQPAVSARVISNATDPVKVAGTIADKALMFALLLFVALIVGIALAFLADYLDERIYSKDEATSLLQLPIYGELPRAPASARVKTDQGTRTPAA